MSGSEAFADSHEQNPTFKTVTSNNPLGTLTKNIRCGSDVLGKERITFTAPFAADCIVMISINTF